ncbi:DUF4052 family protein [Halobacillus salinus]|uniref:DUF4052 domain-containing protein n=1 Tax=Halobacillus salinus TaxID=192814 RepID=A0A4Z0GV51_9BACI|nr:DUF4052 family protein [Halobacillus salinus]TGB00763.1 DUF4052 domain-containing protein [Halobacillus salinus]
MRKDLKAMLYYVVLDYRYTFLIFWAILMCTLVAFTLIGSMFENSSIIVFTGPAAMIFSLICGLNLTKETFPFCIKMGLTRYRYLIGSACFVLLFAAAMSVVHLVVKNAFEFVLTTLGISGISHYSILQFLSMPETWSNELWVLAVLNLLCLTLGFSIGTVFYRYGLIGGFGTIALLFFVIVLPSTREVLAEGLLEMGEGGVTVHFGVLLLISLMAFLPNWPFLHKASTVPARAR